VYENNVILRTDDRPTDRTTSHFGKFQTAIGTGRPIDFVFGPMVGFSGMADRMDLLPVHTAIQTEV